MTLEIRFANREAAEEFAVNATGIWEVYRDDRDPRILYMDTICDAVEAILQRGELVAVLPDHVRDLVEAIIDNCVELDESISPDDISITSR
jgi:hypothetical protein